MQTRRDQLQAYRFQNRRALAALVSGNPNVVEPPMRRLTIFTISGIMIAVLLTVGFTVFGLIRPKAGDTWKKPGSIIVEQTTGATYVYINGTLHPVLNYASAVLAAGSSPSVVNVEQSDLGSTPRGSMIGIKGLPTSLPPADSLLSYPVSVCSRERAADTSNSLAARVSLTLGAGSDARRLPPESSVVVNTGPGTQDYLLLRGRRLAVAPDIVSKALNFSGDTLRVGNAFISAVPPGADLKAPKIAGAGNPSSVRVGSTTARIGQLLHVSSSQVYYVVMADGVAPVNPLQRALLLTLPLDGGRPLAPIETTKTVADVPPSSNSWPKVVAAQLADLPDTITAFDATAAESGGVCAVFRGGSDGRAVIAVPPSTRPLYSSGGTVTESRTSKAGRADDIKIAPGRAALVTSTDASPTVFLIADSGMKFAVTSSDVLTSFKYSSVKPTQLPARLLLLIPTGQALDPKAALQPVTN